MRTVDNSADIIDSRDIIERIEELQGIIDAATEFLEAAQGEAGENHTPDTATCGDCGLSWDDARTSSVTPTPSGRCPFEHIHQEAAELRTLTDLQDEAEAYMADWTHGETLIRDSYFLTYAQELAADIGAISNDMAWPCTCIDWERAARELQMDYTAVDFDGVTYWGR